MKKFWTLFIAGVFIISCLILSASLSIAKMKAPREDLIRNAYQQLLANTDKNGDGKISMAECTSISRDKKKIEKDCRYWDANGDGFITEDEYVKQVIKIMR
jgi:hypothetical protein